MTSHPNPHNLCGDCRARLDRITQLRTELAQLERAVAECAAVTGRYDPSPLVPTEVTR